MIELFKIETNKYDHFASLKCEHSKAPVRGNKYRLYQKPLHYDLRKYFFSNRVVHVWNSLPDEVVTAENVQTFKNRLDRFWKDQEIKYNWKSELSGTGSRTGKM